jgi:hypothetical protein
MPRKSSLSQQCFQLTGSVASKPKNESAMDINGNFKLKLFIKFSYLKGKE